MPMDPKQQQFLVKVATYIEATQSRIDRDNEARSRFTKRATLAAGVLASRGVIGRNHVNEFIDKVASDPTAVWDLVEKMASAMAPDSLGEAAVSKTAEAAGVVDPFERVFFGVGAPQNSGMVD